MDGEGDVARARRGRRRRHGQAASTVRIGTVGDRRLARLGRGQLAADHQLGELAGGHLRRVDGGDRGAAPDDGDVVGDREHLVELVRDEDDGEALALELAQVVEELVDLLRHEHRGGLVEDQDAGAAVEDLEDLDPLAVADAEVLDQGVGSTSSPYASEISLDLGSRAASKPISRARRLAAEDDVLEDREVVGEHEVLVHHADAGGDRVGRDVQGRPPRRRRAIVPSSGRCMP